MRTTLPESDRRNTDASLDEQEGNRDNPRRQREPDREREEDGQDGTGANRSPRRHNA
jgi:hypothetical protein